MLKVTGSVVGNGIVWTLTSVPVSCFTSAAIATAVSENFASAGGAIPPDTDAVIVGRGMIGRSTSVVGPPVSTGTGLMLCHTAPLSTIDANATYECFGSIVAAS